MSRRYTVVVHREEDGSGYYVTVPALPGCFSAGPTEDKALANVVEAIQAHIEGLAKSGAPIPEGDSAEPVKVASVVVAVAA
jgi:antitoxin HicB